MDVEWHKNEAYGNVIKRSKTRFMINVTILVIGSAFVFTSTESITATIALFLVVGGYIVWYVLLTSILRSISPIGIGFSKECIHLKYHDGRERTVFWNSIFNVKLTKPSKGSKIPTTCTIYYITGEQETKAVIINDAALELHRRFEEYKKLPGVAEELRDLKVLPNFLKNNIIASSIAVVVITAGVIIFSMVYIKFSNLFFLICDIVLIALIAILFRLILKTRARMKIPQTPPL